MKFEVTLYFENTYARTKGEFLRFSLNSKTIMHDFNLLEEEYHKFKDVFQDLIYKNDFYKESCIVETYGEYLKIQTIRELFNLVKKVQFENK